HNADIPELNGYFVGRVKNYKDYYAIAAQQCAEVIGDAKNPHTLDPDFEHIWKTVCGLQLNSSNENLFEVANGLGQNGDIGTLIGQNLGTNTSYTYTSGFGGGNVKTSVYYFYSFDSLDLRKDVTCTNISFTNNGYNPPNAPKATEGESFGNDALGWNFAKWRFYWMSPSYLALTKVATSRISTGINWIVMRYSDLLLMYAEAQNELYGPDEANTTAGMTARQALEKVRARAFKTHPERVTGYAGNFFDAIVNERAWELGGEAIRKYDLIRWGLLSKKIEDQKKTLCLMLNGSSKDITIFDKFYPAGTLPQKIYYKWVPTTGYLGTTLYLIDKSSVNWYKTPAVTPSSTVYKNTNWLYASVGASGVVTKMTTILTEAAGLDASYDYSGFTAQLDSVSGINAKLKTFTLGNGVCNYRHPYAIYYTELQNSNNALVNSYGY
ncbi:MAG TPA: RagB/SusD family nutrient uptake outer membrane protein, partial [Bacteroidales bacterium]